ncbi:MULTISPECIES: Ig-like domain-containing protein [unclassified Sporosarcina]|uniref:Ig-like domain-containing protein n=1 Tax=unclassified Sporosarcina TaxID=2647733 RepID=UPI000C168BC1|nr:MULTISPECIES: Ig-like domain-containing protein [unclassified Sporosarcina]PID05849.1 hypothetical protein CSV66_07610 [Sporosarcina sp. P30]PID09043.1 hypothetical protein CSV65_07610 [Sporosarcina sp. P31]PID12340.1 hypothetical protein CSV64_07080 [Sporosarcina sp. P32b]
MWKRFFLSTVLMCLVTLVIAPAASAKSFPSKSVHDAMKTWNIKFSLQVEPSTVTEANIYIMDGSKKHAASVELLRDGRTIKVTPRTSYVPGKVYRLEVSDKMRSIKGVVLSAKTTMPFEVTDPSAAIETLHYTSGKGLHHFKITVKPEVHSVKINGISLRMTGWNEFTHTITNLKAGSSVTIKAYNEKNRTIETKTYKLD